MADFFARTIDYMLMGECNLACPFCYGPDPNDKRTLTRQQTELLFDFLRSRNVGGVVIAGGEPTLSRMFDTTLEYLARKQFWLALQTNATRPHVLLPHLDKLSWLALPLDGVSAETGAILRTSRQHYRTVTSLATHEKVAAARNEGLRLKIGTVLTPQNIGEIRNIAMTVEKFAPDVWKIYQLRPRGAGRLNSRFLSTSADEFSEVTRAITNEFSHLNIIASPAAKSARAYLIVNPDSSLLVTQYDRYLSYGRLVSETGQVDENVWESAVRGLDVEAYAKNVLDSFPGDNPFVMSEAASGQIIPAAERQFHRLVPREVFDRDGQ